MQDRDFYAYESLGKDLLKMCSEVRATHAAFMSQVNITDSYISSLDKQGKAKLQAQYTGWLKAYKEQSK